MKFYFQLQWRRFHRIMKELGFAPLITYVILPVILVSLMNLAYTKSKYTGFVLLIFYIKIIQNLNNNERIQHLKIIFGNNTFFKIRCIENFILAIPFLLVFIIHNDFRALSIQVLLILLLLFRASNKKVNLVLSTPFSASSHEFIEGLRKFWYWIVLSYSLTYIAITEDNVNIGLFALILLLISVLGYYNNIERDYIIWSNKRAVKEFLRYKIKQGVVGFLVLSLPIILSLGVFYPSHIDTLMIGIVICLLFIATIILAKYEAFPNNIGFSQQILILVSVIFLPMLLGVIPYFYLGAIKKLKSLLLYGNN